MSARESDQFVPGLGDAAVAHYRADILDAARAQLRRFGEAKTNMVDVARALGTSHTTLYRHFRSKAELFDALVLAMVREEQEIAAPLAAEEGPASDRLARMVLALHAAKTKRLAEDPELFRLYWTVLETRPAIVAAYATMVTRSIALILAGGVKAGEFRIDDVAAASCVVRDAVTVFLHPAHVAGAAEGGAELQALARNVIRTLCTAFRAGLTLR